MEATTTENQNGKRTMGAGPAGSIYGFAFLGALVYYIQHATSFWEGVLGIFKAIFWPGMLVYKVLELLKM